MEKDFFTTKCICKFAIIIHDTDCNLVTKELGIMPDRCCNKGDKITSEHTHRTGNWQYGVWEIKSKTVISEELDLSSHIKYFQDVLSDKIEVLTRLKNQYRFEYVFSVSIETEDAGVGIDLSQSEISFINKVADRFSCAFISKISVSADTEN